jgi:hypothetical protein
MNLNKKVGVMVVTVLSLFIILTETTDKSPITADKSYQKYPTEHFNRGEIK